MTVGRFGIFFWVLKCDTTIPMKPLPKMYELFQQLNVLQSELQLPSGKLVVQDKHASLASGSLAAP